jgi:hypothetical protein
LCSSVKLENFLFARFATVNNKHEHYKVKCVTQTQKVFFCTFIYTKVPFYLTTLNHMHFQERRAIKPALSAQGLQQSIININTK